MQRIFAFFETNFRINRLNRRLIYVALSLMVLLIVGLIAKLSLRSSAANDVNAITIAVALPLSGENSFLGKTNLQGIQLYVDSVNQSGGVDGHPLKLLPIDDQSDPAIAPLRAKEIVNSPALVVLGHSYSNTSKAAGSVYQAGGISAITGSATADTITSNNPYYFRTIFTNSEQGSTIASYIQKELRFQTATVVYTTDNFGKSVKAAFESTFKRNGAIKHSLFYDPNVNDRNQQIQNIVNAIVADADPGVIFLGMNDVPASELIVPLRRRGIKATMFGTDALSNDTFNTHFQKYDEEKQHPGLFVDGIYAASPLIFDSANADVQEFVAAYHQAYATEASWENAKFYDVARIAVEAIRAAKVQNTPKSRQQDRQRIRDQLAALNSPDTAFRSLTGPIYFDRDRNPVQPIRVGQFVNQKLISAPVQYTSVSNPALVNLEQELKAGSVIRLDNHYVWRQKVIYTGIDINKLSRIEQKNSSITAEFYLWFRYPDAADATNIEFPGGTNLISSLPLFDPAAPLVASTINGLNYRLYQLRGEFKNTFDLRDYPFDRQKLVIHFQNTTIPNDRLIYVIDKFGLRLPRADTEAESKPYESLQLWKFQGIQYAQANFRTDSTKGDPHLLYTDNRIDYPGFKATITLQRRSLVFLVKNLLPLILLTLVPMTTLYFSERLKKDRPPVAVSALISGTVLLVGVHNQLPDVGYTVALEYIFYVFFGLSLFSVAVAIISDRLSLMGHKLFAKQIDQTARTIYALIMLLTVVAYWVAFRDRLS